MLKTIPYAHKDTESLLEVLGCEVISLSDANETYEESDEISHQVFVNSMLIGYIYVDHGVFYPGCRAPGNYNTADEAALDLIPPYILEDAKLMITERRNRLPDYM